MEEAGEIADSAVTFFQKQFTKEGDAEDFSMIDEVPTLITEEQNTEIMKPAEEEIKSAVMGLNRNSVGDLMV